MSCDVRTLPSVLPDVLLNDNQGCFQSIVAHYYAQVSVSVQERNICSADFTSSVVEVMPYDLILDSCVIRGKRRYFSLVIAY